jgi:hypothetical protein
MGVKEDETAKVNAIGDKIRELKKAKAAKEEIMAEVEKLKAAKAAYEAAVGEPFPAPAPAPSKKKKKEAPAPAPAKNDGELSKNEAKKAARKAAAAVKKAEYAKGTIPPKEKASPGAPKGPAKPAAAAPAPAPAGSGSKVGAMDAAQVQTYLSSFALGKYAKALGGVDGATLASMDDAALKSRGVTFAPHRRKLLKLVSGAGGGGTAAIAAVALAGATVAANATPLLATVISALAAVQEQIGSGETSPAPAPYSHAAVRPSAAAASAPAASAGAGGATGATAADSTGAPMDSALVACAHRFYIAVGMLVEAQRTAGGPWEPAKVCGPPRDDLGCWDLQADGEGDWKAQVNYTSIRPRRKFAAPGAAAGGSSASAPADWRAKLPAVAGVPRLQVLPGAQPSSPGAPEVAALNAELDDLEGRITKLEAKKKARGGKGGK